MLELYRCKVVMSDRTEWNMGCESTNWWAAARHAWRSALLSRWEPVTVYVFNRGKVAGVYGATLKRRRK